MARNDCLDSELFTAGLEDHQNTTDQGYFHRDVCPDCVRFFSVDDLWRDPDVLATHDYKRDLFFALRFHSRDEVAATQ